MSYPMMMGQILCRREMKSDIVQPILMKVSDRNMELPFHVAGLLMEGVC